MPEKKSFVLTGYVERSTCNCGCVTHNCFWQDGGFGGSAHLASLHHNIEKYLDELSGAGPGKQGNPADAKVTITIEPLGEHDHRILNRHEFSGLGMDDQRELNDGITAPAEPEEVVELKGDDQYNKDYPKHDRTVGVNYLQDIHDRLLLVERGGDMAKLADLRESLQDIIDRKD